MDPRFLIQGVDARTPLAQAAPAILLAKAEPLFQLEDAARAGADADAVHDMRVASRRVREAMRLFRPLYPPKEFRRWYRRVRSITRVLGPVRDADVFIDEFSRIGRDLGEGGKRTVAFLVGLRAGQREQALAVLDEQLEGLDLAKNRASFERLARDVRSAASRAWLADYAHAEVAKRAAAVFGAQPAALDEANAVQQHLLRIHYKRLRYAVEGFAPCYGDGFDDLHDTLTAFQDALGDLHDAHVFFDLLADPDLRAMAGRAGAGTEDVAEVEALLTARAHALFAEFVELESAHPAASLLPQLLLPLATSGLDAEGAGGVGDGGAGAAAAPGSSTGAEPSAADVAARAADRPMREESDALQLPVPVEAGFAGDPLASDDDVPRLETAVRSPFDPTEQPWAPVHVRVEEGRAPSSDDGTADGSADALPEAQE